MSAHERATIQRERKGDNNMRIRFYGGKVCTMAQGAVLTQDELWTSGGRVEYVGPAKRSTERFDREINLDGDLLLPGFKNAHTHSAMTFLRSYADDLPLLDWLEQQVFPMEAKLTGEDVYQLSRLAIMEYLTSGITANFDMYGFPRETARATVDTGFRTVLCGALTSFDNTLEGLEWDYQHFNRYHQRISMLLGFHAEYTNPRPLLEGVAALAEKYKAPVWCHNSEGAPEVADCLQRTGKTPTAYLDSYDIFKYGGGGYHCVHLTQEDMEIFRQRGMWVVTNPGSNSKLASGIAPLTQMQQLGIPLAIGTDGSASNNCLDFFREMFLVTALQKLREDDAAAMDALQVLEMATVGGARAMGLTDCDSLAVGKCADLVVIDMQQPNMQPVNNPLKNLVYSGSKSNVRLTMVGGKILFEQGRFDIGVSPKEVYAKANEIINCIR